VTRIRQQCPFWAKDAKICYSTINAKAETIATAPAFRQAFKSRRCLVPADLFYEWQKIDAKTKQPFAIDLKDGTPYAFAGLWERWRDPKTRAAGDVHDHHDRSERASGATPQPHAGHPRAKGL
jgi:putative SOS response-associated peptidase YedK